MDSWLDNSGCLRRPEADIESITTDSGYKKRNPRWLRQNCPAPYAEREAEKYRDAGERDAP